MTGSGTGARVLLVIGFLAACIGYDAWLTAHVVLDPSSTRAAAHALMQTPPVRKALADDLTKELDRRLPGATRDPRVGAAVRTALADPRVTNAFADTVASIHEAVLSGTGDRQTFTVDGRSLSAALHDALAPSDPQLAAKLAAAPPLDVHFTHGQLPHLHDPRSTADVVTVLAVVAALLFVAASLLLRHDRRAVARVGRRTAYLSITPLLVFVLLPRLLSHASGDTPRIAAPLLETYGSRVLPSAIALAVAGIAIAVGAFLWPRDASFAGSEPRPAPSRYASPPPPRRAPDDPAITEKLYL